MILEEKKKLYNELRREWSKHIHTLSYEEFFEKTKNDNLLAVEKALAQNMPVYTWKGNKSTDPKNTIANLNDIVRLGEALKDENVYDGAYKNLRKISNKVQQGSQKIYIEASTFLMLEHGERLGDNDSFSCMLNHCILFNIENSSENIVKRAYEIIFKKP